MSSVAIGKPVRDARQRLRQAHGILQATDIRTIAVAQEYLSGSVALLAQLKLSLESTKAEAKAELRSEMVAIKKEIALLLQLVDAKATFYRGFDVRFGNSGICYSRGGGAVEQAVHLEVKLHG